MKKVVFIFIILIQSVVVSAFHVRPSSSFLLSTQNNARSSSTSLSLTPFLDPFSNEISSGLISVNSFFKYLTIPPIRNFLTQDITPNSNSSNSSISTVTKPTKPYYTPFETVTSPPALPPIPRPAWLVITSSIPTGLVWYGYYKFSIEEELFQLELAQTGKVSGAGGYGKSLRGANATAFEERVLCTGY
jgi:hypothetical protein